MEKEPCPTLGKAGKGNGSPIGKGEEVWAVTTEGRKREKKAKAFPQGGKEVNSPFSNSQVLEKRNHFGLECQIVKGKRSNFTGSG